MRGFVTGLILALGGGLAAAALVEAAPLAPLRVAASLALGSCVYFAARGGAPGFPVIAHLFGVAFGALALGANWAGWLVVIADYNAAAALDAAPRSLDAGWDRLQTLSREQGVAVGGRVVEGATLQAFWAGQVALLMIAAVIGGHSATLLRRARRRARAR